MKNGFLPIGSVVLLKDAKKRLMITGFCMTDKNDASKKYDYCGCLYPEGIIDANKIALFNHNQIDRVYFIGLQDIDEFEFKRRLAQVLNKKENETNDQVNKIADNNNVEPNTNIANN